MESAEKTVLLSSVDFLSDALGAKFPQLLLQLRESGALEIDDLDSIFVRFAWFQKPDRLPKPVAKGGGWARGAMPLNGNNFWTSGGGAHLRKYYAFGRIFPIS